nr:hypothetical protein K-LCC10_0005 [Kaumoebavirus]
MSILRINVRVEEELQSYNIYSTVTVNELIKTILESVKVKGTAEDYMLTCQGKPLIRNRPLGEYQLPGIIYLKRRGAPKKLLVEFEGEKLLYAADEDQTFGDILENVVEDLDKYEVIRNGVPVVLSDFVMGGTSVILRKKDSGFIVEGPKGEMYLVPMTASRIIAYYKEVHALTGKYILQNERQHRIPSNEMVTSGSTVKIIKNPLPVFDLVDTKYGNAVAPGVNLFMECEQAKCQFIAMLGYGEFEVGKKECSLCKKLANPIAVIACDAKIWTNQGAKKVQTGKIEVWENVTWIDAERYTIKVKLI